MSSRVSSWLTVNGCASSCGSPFRMIVTGFSSDKRRNLSITKRC
jgi:hypothetical protein